MTATEIVRADCDAFDAQDMERLLSLLTCRLPAGAFFEKHHGRIARVSNDDNLNDGIAQVGG